MEFGARNERRRILAAIVLGVQALGGASACRPEWSEPRLVVLYATCSLNKDLLSPYNSEIRFTPNFEAFARDARVFTRNIAEAGQSGIAFASLFSGVHADVHGVYRHPFRLGNHLYQISEAYRDAGYETFFWSGHQLASYGLKYGQGVPKRNAYVRRRHARFDEYTANDAEFAALLRRLQDDPDYKAFVQINFTLTHAPYHRYALAPVRRRFLEAYPEQRPALRDEDVARLLTLYSTHLRPLQRNFPETVERLGLSARDVQNLVLLLDFVYKAAVYQLDTYFGRFLDSIREAGLYDESLIVFTADHGEILYRENALYKWTHGLQLAPEVLNVPLILRAPSLAVRPGSYDEVTRSIDVYPTMAGLSRVPIPPEAPVEGVDLTPALLGREPAPELIAFSHTATLGGLVLKSYKKLTLAISRIPREDVNLSWVSAHQGDLVYKWTFDGTDWSYAVFDLAVDPLEARDLYDPADPGHAELVEKLHAYKQRLVRAYPGPSGPLSPQNLENLGALGYIDDTEPAGDER